MPGDVRPTAAVLTLAPLVEALLELHFAPVTTIRGYGPVPGQMYARLKDDYPDAQDLEAADIPFSVGLRVVRHRFLSSDGKRMFQVGNGILSVNTLAYDHYASFQDQVATVLNVAIEVFGEPTRAILRYINKIPMQGRSVQEVLAAFVRLPDAIGEINSQQVKVIAGDEASGSETQVVWANPVDGQSDLLLLDLTASRGLQTSDASSVMEWMYVAHDLIETRFLAMIQPEFLELLK